MRVTHRVAREDELAGVVAINRIRRRYAEIEPRYAEAVALPEEDSVSGMMTEAYTRFQMLFTTGTVVGGVNSVLVAATTALALSAGGVELVLATLVGVAVGTVSATLHMSFQARRWKRAAGSWNVS